MRLKFMTIVSVLVIIVAGSALAGVTGRITGEITDASTNEPIIGVTVSVQGTSSGAITDLDGRYLVMNIPVGDYTLVISAVGYATVEISNLHVSADLATYQSYEMTSQATELGTIISVTAETPIIIKDKTTTMNIVRAEEILAMPVRGFEDVVGLQNSVVRLGGNNFTKRQRGDREAIGNGSEINLRGGRRSEVAYYVDGFSQQDPLSGISTANINNNAIKEISIISGAFSAEYGHVSSGIINVVTNSGTDEYHGTIDAVTDNVVGDKFDQNWYEADFGGPIPGLENGTFFLSGERRWLADRTPSSKTEEFFTQSGIDTVFSEPHRMPGNSLAGWSFQGKIDYDFSPNFKLALSGNGSIDNWREFRQEWLLSPEHAPRYKDENYGVNAKITHTLNSKTFYNLSASFFLTERLRGDGVIFDDYNAYYRDNIPADPEFEQFLLFRDPMDSATGAPSYYGRYLHRRAWYLGIRGDLTAQLNADHTTKIGFEFQRHTLRLFENLNATKFQYLDATEAESNPGLVNRYGFNKDGEFSDDEGTANETKHPINLGLYVQDRLEWRGLILNAGLRFDYFDYKAQRVKNLADPFAGDATLDDEDLEDSEKFYRLSPRLGVSFPISDVTQMHINYGKYYQRPDLNRLYAGLDFFQKRVVDGSYYPFPSPNLEPEKTTQYEVAMTHKMSATTSFDVVAYYKDITDLTQIFHQAPAFPQEYDYYANGDYGTVKGVEFGFDMRRTNNIALNIKYTLSWVNGTGSQAETSYQIAWKNSDGIIKAVSPLDYDQRHSFTGNFNLRFGEGEGPVFGEATPLENFGVHAIVQLSSGTPYTPTLFYESASEGSLSSNPITTINAGRLPWYFTIDLKAEKTFSFGSYSIVPYVSVLNLLDHENVSSVYEATGKADTDGWLSNPSASTDPDYVKLYNMKIANPTNYFNPRMFLFGLRASF